MFSTFFAPPARWHRITLLFALLAVVLATTALAGVENPADRAAVRAVKLDMGLIKRLDAVVTALDEADDTPPLFLRTKANKVPKTLPELEAELRTSPALQAAIAAQGFTPRQYLLAAMAWTNAWLGYHLAKDGDKDASTAASTAQMAFVERHYAELKALQDR